MKMWEDIIENGNCQYEFYQEIASFSKFLEFYRERNSSGRLVNISFRHIQRTCWIISKNVTRVGLCFISKYSNIYKYF